MRATGSVVALALGVLCAGWSGATENPGVTAAPILQVPLGARAFGMGTAFTAVASDIYTLHYNPAGLANLSYREASAMYLSGLDEQDVEFVALGSPLPFTGFTGSGYATIGASLLFSQNGTLEFNGTDADGSLRESRTVDAGGDLVATVGYAERLADTPLESPDSTTHVHHFLGASGKFVRSTLAGAYSARTFAADVGYLARSPELGVSVGASLMNLGGKMKFLEEGDPLPLTARVGGAYTWTAPTVNPQTLTWAADWEYQYYERQWFVNAGLEYWLMKAWAGRIGYQVRREVAGLTVGFGTRFRTVLLDYAWGMNKTLGDAHRFSFTLRFGGVPIREREKARRPFIESVPEREQLRDLEQEKPSTMDAPRRPRRRAPEAPRGAPGWIY